MKGVPGQSVILAAHSPLFPLSLTFSVVCVLSPFRPVSQLPFNSPFVRWTRQHVNWGLPSGGPPSLLPSSYISICPKRNNCLRFTRTPYIRGTNRLALMVPRDPGASCIGESGHWGPQQYITSRGGNRWTSDEIQFGSSSSCPQVFPTVVVAWGSRLFHLRNPFTG